MRGGSILTLVIAVAAAVSGQTARQASGATILVSCDRACLWTLDGQPMGKLGEGDSRIAAVSLGQHRIRAEAQEGMYLDEKKIDLDDASQTVVRLSLKEVQGGASPAMQPVATALVAATESCVQAPTVSTKVPALPAGSSCVKHLYTVSDARLEYVSPLEGLALTPMVGWKRAPESYSLDYVDIRVGTGPIAVLHKWITVHYTGYLMDGTKFDSSLDRGEPIVFPYSDGRVIVGWDTGFAGMRVGGKRRLFIPSQLAYGADAKGLIPANAALIFDVEFIGQSDLPSGGYPSRSPAQE